MIGYMVVFRLMGLRISVRMKRSEIRRIILDVIIVFATGEDTCAPGDKRQEERK